MLEGTALVGRRVRKLFGKRYYGGVVTSYLKRWAFYKIAYDDGCGACRQSAGSLGFEPLRADGTLAWRRRRRRAAVTERS